MEHQTVLLDAMRDASVERIRFQRRAEGVQVVAAKQEGDWQDVLEVLPGSGEDVQSVCELFRQGGHERLEMVFRRETGLRFFCAVHSTRRGPGAGGLRRHDLVTPEIEVIGDVLNLARAMTYKNMVADVGCGGSKLCVHNPPLPDYGREAWLDLLAEEIDLSGTLTGPDTGFPRGVFHDLAQRTAQVTGIRGGGTSLTAAFGVRQALQATTAALGLPVNDAHIAIQGLGALGTALAEPLAREGARLTVTDQDHRRIDALLSSLSAAERRKVGVVAPYQILDVEVDVLAPCAVGGIVSEDNLGKLRCRAVCGGANNQLAARSLEEELGLARRLMDRGILYVPDWIASAGGTIHGTLEARCGDDFDPKKAQARVRRVCGWLVNEILDEAKQTGRTALEIAVDRFLSP